MLPTDVFCVSRRVFALVERFEVTLQTVEWVETREIRVINVACEIFIVFYA